MRYCFKKYSKDTRLINTYISVVLLLTNHETSYNLKILCWASTHLLSQSLPFLQLQVCVCASTNIQLSFSSTRTALQNKDQT